MNDSCNVIGFIGVEKHDILMYLSRILYHLEQRILIVDLSEKKSLLCGLQQEVMDRKNMEEQKEDGNVIINKEKEERGEVTDFRGVHYYQDNLDWNELGEMFLQSKLKKKDYDTILIDFGFTNQSVFMKACNHLWYITDLQRYHVKEMLQQQFFKNIPSYLLIKDVLDCKITPKLIQNEFNESVPFQKTFIAYQDSYDNKYKIECQYSQSIYFGKLSKELTEYLFQIIIVTYPEFTLNYIKKAYNMARKGR